MNRCAVCGSMYLFLESVIFRGRIFRRWHCISCDARSALFPISVPHTSVWCEEDQDDTQLLLFSTVDAP